MWATISQAAGVFAVTNIDDIVILALFFGRAGSGHRTTARIVIGQYLGFAAILAISVLAAFGAQLLPPVVIPYLGLLPVALGLRAARALSRWGHPLFPAVLIAIGLSILAHGGAFGL